MPRLLYVIFVIFCAVLPLAADTADAALTLQHEAGVVSAAWNADESLILTASQAGRARVFSAVDGEALLSIDHAGAPLTHALWVGDDSHAILSADESGSVKLSGAGAGELIQEWTLDSRPLHLELNAAGTLALAFTEAGRGAILSLSDGETVATVQREGAIVGAGFSADERHIRAWAEDGGIVVWDAATGAQVAEFRVPHRAMLRGLEWNHDDSLLLAWFVDGSVSVYESGGMHVNGRAIRSVRHRSFAQRARFSRDESLVMSWAADDTAHVWRIADGESRLRLRHEDWVVGAAWDSEEARILSWSHIFVTVWDGADLSRQYRHGNLVRGAAWNSDSSQVLSWSWDGSARVWQAE